MTTMSTKLSICLIYRHLFRKVNSRLFRATRIVTHGLTVLVIAYYVPAFFVSIFQCSPVSKSWLSKTAGTCIDLTKFRFYNAAFNIITSVLIIATPLPALCTVRRSRPEVSELMVLILLGMVSVVVFSVQLRLGVANSSQSYRLYDRQASTDDIPRCRNQDRPTMQVPPPPLLLSIEVLTCLPGANITPLAIAIVEMNVGIIAASLIVMHPCLKAIHNATSKRLTQSLSFSRGNTQSTSSRIAGLLRDKNVGRSTDIELESQPVSTHEVHPKEML